MRHATMHTLGPRGVVDRADHEHDLKWTPLPGNANLEGERFSSTREWAERVLAAESNAFPTRTKPKPRAQRPQTAKPTTTPEV